jgi:hypothetical protein
VDIAAMIDSANLLVQQANELEASGPSNTGINVSELVFQARKLAMSQYFLAAFNGFSEIDNITVSQLNSNPNLTKGLDLMNTLTTQRPSDQFLINLSLTYNDDRPITELPSKTLLQVKNNATAYKATYQPLASTIVQLNLQSQQANKVITKGGNIENNADANGNASQNEDDANAINACQNATCT